jgi:hypothetical protein
MQEHKASDTLWLRETSTASQKNLPDFRSYRRGSAPDGRCSSILTDAIDQPHQKVIKASRAIPHPFCDPEIPAPLRFVIKETCHPETEAEADSADRPLRHPVRDRAAVPKETVLREPEA